jgi:branched-chain amino acid aminotransferase
VRVIEKTLFPKDLEAADEIFISSTTRELLPVVSIQGLSIRTGRGLRGQLQQALSEYVDSYVNARKKADIIA